MTHSPPLAIALILALTFISCSENTTPSQPEGSGNHPQVAPEFAWASNSWAARSRLPTARERNAAGVVKNSVGESIVYVLGGVAPDDFGTDVSTIEAYKYATNTWTTKTSRFKGTWTNGVGVIGGKLYISGGFSSTGALKTLYVYDPLRDRLTRKADMPRRFSSGVTGVIGGKLYVLPAVCNNCTNTFSRRFYRYDPSTNVWTSLPSCPRIHADGAGGVISGRFYVAGGGDGTEIDSPNLDVYDPVTNKWKSLHSMPEPVRSAGGAVVDNQLYSVGGVGSRGHWKVFAYNPVTNTWRTKAPMLIGRQWPAATTITAFGNSKILAMGGFKDGNLTGELTDTSAASANEAYKP